VAHDEWVGTVQDYSSDVTEEDWEQPRMLWKIFKQKGEDKDFIHNLSGHLSKALPEVQKETISEFAPSCFVCCINAILTGPPTEMWANVDEEISRRLDEALKELGNAPDHSKVPPNQTALKRHMK
jgi:catalase